MRLYRRLPLLLGLWAFLAHGHEGPDASTTAKHRSSLAIGAAVSPAGDLWIVGVDEQGKLVAEQRKGTSSTLRLREHLDTGGDAISADGENHPKIAFGPNNAVVISYTKPLAKPYTGDIRLLRSTDGGAHFSLPVTVHRDRQVITHRFESIAFDAKGTLHTVWIDKRDQVGFRATGNQKENGYRGAAIYRNESQDAGLTFGPDIKVADHSCECCRIALAPAPAGGIAALWRHVFSPNVRDHAFAVLGGPQLEPVRASKDNWKFDACPHHGPGLATAQGGGYHAVWFGYRDGRPAVRYGRLDASGKPTGTVRELPDAQAEHADVLAIGNFVAVVWRSFDGEATRLRAWVSRNGGDSFSLRELASSSEDNDHPRLVQGGNAKIVVWRTASDTQVIPLDGDS